MMQACMLTMVLASCVPVATSEDLAVVLLQVHAEATLATAAVAPTNGSLPAVRTIQNKPINLVASTLSPSLRSVASIAKLASTHANRAANQLSKAAEAPVIVRADVSELGAGDRNRLFNSLGDTNVVFQDRDGSARLFPAPKLAQLVAFIANTRNISTATLQSKLKAKGVACPNCNKDSAVEKVIDLYLNGPAEPKAKKDRSATSQSKTAEPTSTKAFKLGSGAHGEKHTHKAKAEVLKESVHKVSDVAHKVHASRDLFALRAKTHAHEAEPKASKQRVHKVSDVGHKVHTPRDLFAGKTHRSDKHRKH